MRVATSLMIAAMGLIIAYIAAAITPDPEMRRALLGLCILGGMICLALLLPDFDGRGEEDWDSYDWPRT